MTLQKSARILVVEDDDDVAELLVSHLQLSVCGEVRRAADAEEAFEQVLDCTPDLIIADLMLPGDDGLSLIRRLRSISSVPVVLITGQPTLGRAVAALRLGVVDLLAKPFDLQRLTDVIVDELSRARRERRALRRSRKLRRIAERAIRQRDHVREQLNLVCRDLVAAHRNLAEQVQNAIDGRAPRGD
jgi:two-component system OmpR family response regulator